MSKKQNNTHTGWPVTKLILEERDKITKLQIMLSDIIIKSKIYQFYCMQCGEQIFRDQVKCERCYHKIEKQIEDLTNRHRHLESVLNIFVGDDFIL